MAADVPDDVKKKASDPSTKKANIKLIKNKIKGTGTPIKKTVLNRGGKK